jgi:DNA-nicking Smr family endonuclease
MVKLDLHGIKHNEVEKLIDAFIFDNNGNSNLRIITGNSEKMKLIVVNTIKQYGYDHRIGDTLGMNTGYIDIF